MPPLPDGNLTRRCVGCAQEKPLADLRDGSRLTRLCSECRNPRRVSKPVRPAQPPQPPPEPPERDCPTCKRSRPVADFFLDRRGVVRDRHCRDCRAGREREREEREARARGDIAPDLDAPPDVDYLNIRPGPGLVVPGRWCTRCQQRKPLDDFGTFRRAGKEVRRSQCRPCRTAQERARRDAQAGRHAG